MVTAQTTSNLASQSDRATNERLAREGIKRNGRVEIKVIAPGQGATSFYRPEVLRRAVSAGMFDNVDVMTDHEGHGSQLLGSPSIDQKLGWIMPGTARYETRHPNGEGVYAIMEVRAPHREYVYSLLGSGSGMSIIADGPREDPYDKKSAVKEFTKIKSVDIVLRPGAGGAVTKIIESEEDAPATIVETAPPGSMITRMYIESDMQESVKKALFGSKKRAAATVGATALGTGLVASQIRLRRAKKQEDRIAANPQKYGYTPDPQPGEPTRMIRQSDGTIQYHGREQAVVSEGVKKVAVLSAVPLAGGVGLGRKTKEQMREGLRNRYRTTKATLDALKTYRDTLQGGGKAKGKKAIQQARKEGHQAGQRKGLAVGTAAGTVGTAAGTGAIGALSGRKEESEVQEIRIPSMREVILGPSSQMPTDAGEVLWGKDNVRTMRRAARNVGFAAAAPTAAVIADKIRKKRRNRNNSTQESVMSRLRRLDPFDPARKVNPLTFGARRAAARGAAAGTVVGGGLSYGIGHLKDNRKDRKERERKAAAQTESLPTMREFLARR